MYVRQQATGNQFFNTKRKYEQSDGNKFLKVEQIEANKDMYRLIVLGYEWE